MVTRCTVCLGMSKNRLNESLHGKINVPIRNI